MHGTYVQLYKGKYFIKPKYKNNNKVIAFDLDETLGSFVDLDMLWRALKPLESLHHINVDFNKLLDLYPEFLRYGILPILEYLYKKKKSKKIDKIYIYTNNQCHMSWPALISNYFNYKLNANDNVFDKIILAFKINNKHIELSRTTHDKTHRDFIKCTLLPKSTEICFIDNSEFNEMKTERVYYIQPASYYHALSVNEIINRFINSEIGYQFAAKIESKQLYDKILEGFNYFDNDRSTNRNLDIYVAQKMMYYIKEFFFLTNKKIRTKKIKHTNIRVTRKKYN
jgi:hypothetical protein